MRRRATLAAVVAGFLASPVLLAQPGREGVAWARFDDPSGVASSRPIVASDIPGDATLASLAVEAGMLRVEGWLGLERGSRWATLGAEIAPEGIEAGANLSGAGVLRIRLASAVARPLRVRIKGGDREIGNAGCYPVVVQMVATVPADYVMPLSAFRAPGWCGANAPTIAQTLRAVQHVEVTANDEPQGAVSFSVGGIEFLADASREYDAQPRTVAKREETASATSTTRGAAPASSPPAAPRRRVAVAGQAASMPAPAASKRVVCEFSTRYQLMLCH